jgi:hypothetical protein
MKTLPIGNRTATNMQAWRLNMKIFGKTLGLLLASLALASCGGAGSNGGAFSPAPSSTITLSATSTTLPVNVSGYLPTQYGNPTQATVTMTWRNPDGSLVSGHDLDVSISPPNVAALSCLVGPGCTNGDQLFGSIVVAGINGQATVFVNAGSTAGTANFTVSGIDPTTQRTVSASMVFTVTSGVGPAPATVTLVATPTGVYLPSSGGSNTSSISATVRDGAGQLVPDPVSGNSGVDNIQFQIVGNAGDATLSSGSGTGTTVTSHTVHGVATVSFQAGDATPQGPVQIRATVDRADNNVSNGIQDPISFTTSIIVSDGKLFSLVITSPTTNAIQVNPVSSNVTSGSGTIPPNPDGTYSLTVSAIGTDRQGNPVIAGTSIQFGVVDGPMAGFPAQGGGTFLIGGNDGDPQEGGTLFTAPTGHFRTAGGGAGPGDTLLVFGKLVPGNRDLESARQIQTVNSDTSLSVTYPFNPNDDTGTSVNYGPVLPYVIGRAEEGNIGASSITDAHGVAHTTLNYPVSRLGKGAFIWAQGASGVVAATGRPRLVADISGGGFPGVAPGQLVVNQTPLPGNTTVNVQVCLYDNLGAPIQGAAIGFGFTNLGLGTGSIDGTPNSGVFANPTGAGGCTSGVFTTSGLAGSAGGTGGPVVTFTDGPSTPALIVPITASGNLILQASPSSLGGSGGSVTLVLTDANGHPVPSAQISGTCTAGAGIASTIAPTDANGRTTASITANLNAYGSSNTATCTFTTGLAGGPTATVNLTGTDLCTVDPTNPLCTGGTPPTNDVLSVVVVRDPAVPAATTVAVTSTPAGISCNLMANVSTTLCSALFPDGSTVLLNATATPASGRTFVWGGSCSAVSATAATVIMTAGASCTVTVH